MATRSGSGSSLGAALRAAYGPQVLRRPMARSWSARLNQLTASARGQEILARHADPGRGGRKWAGWLAGDVTPSKRSQQQIEAAYLQYLGRDSEGRPKIDHGREIRISGLVEIRDSKRGLSDIRDRGGPLYGPLRVDHWNADHEGKWARFDAALAGDGTDDDLAYYYAADVMDADDDLSWSDPASFPGGAYQVTVVG